MKLIFLHIILLTTYFSFSQGLINTASNLYLTANSNLILSGNANWIQNGTVTCANGSNVKFTGNAYQYIQGINTTNFSNVIVNNSGGGVVAGRNFSISGVLTLTLGHFDLKQYIVDLGTTGSVSGENENARIRATSGVLGGGAEGGNTGTIRAIRDNPSGNVAGLGLNFNPSVALGNNTLIERGCNPLQGSGSFTLNYSIFRWYRITPGTGVVNSITVNNFYYWGGSFNLELNSHIESQLQMFQQVQYWNGSTNPIYWEPRNTTINTGSDFVSSSTTSNPIMLNYIFITLASTSSPLPVEYLYFNGFCKENYRLLKWQTASETNNYGFIVQSKNQKNNFWEDIGFVYGNGNSNQIINYSFYDYNNINEIVILYRLKQIDFDGIVNYSDIINITCDKKDDFNIFYENGNLQIITLEDKKFDLNIVNILGQIIYSKKDLKSNFITNLYLSSGLYYIYVIDNNDVILKKVLKINNK